MTEALRRAGETAPIHYDAEKFSLTAKGREAELYLGNAYLEYQSIPPAARPGLLRNFVRVWFLRPEKMPTSFEDLKPDLLLYLRSRSFYEVERLRQQPGAESSYLPLGEHLAVAVAYDLPEAKIELNQASLNEARVGFDEAFRAACDNLREMSQQGLVSAARGVWVSPWQDSYDAARLVLHDLIRRHPVLGDHVAMVPNQDSLIVTGSEDQTGLTLMTRLAEKGLRQARSLSGVALRWTGESWVPFLPPFGHPLHMPFRRLWMMSIEEDYARQKKALDALRGEKGADGFVAGYFREADGYRQSLCVWPNGLAALLPRTDKVCFTRKKGKATYEVAATGPWERVCEVVGDLMEPLGIYPERYRVRAFPTAEQLRAISVGN
jgi:hypothetical protein